MDQRIRALLIEDDPDYSLLMDRYINEACGQSLKYVLECATSLHDGLDLLAHKEFDIVLLDLMLPDSRGLDTLAQVHREAPGIPIVVLTNLEAEAIGLQAIVLGAQEFLYKGKVTALQLRRAIAYAFERNRLFGQMQALVSASPDGVVIIDQAGMVHYANPAALTLFNRAAGEFEGRPFGFPLSVDVPSELQLPSSDGTHTVEMRVVPIEWKGNKVRLATLRDITGLKRLEQIRAEVKERRRMDQLKDNLLNTVSHELRTPLSIIKATIGNIRDRLAGPLTEDQEEMIRSADRNVARLTRILNNFLDLSRLESGRARVEQQSFDPAALLREITNDLRMTYKSKDVELLLNLAPELPSVLADRDMITQVIGNVLDNALRYARDCVQVRAAHTGGEVVVSIIDDGRGIPEGKSEDLFNKFIQLERPKGGDGYKGAGLGLAICREIMEINGGHIWVENTRGWGAGFHIALPLAVPALANVPEGGRVDAHK